MDFPSQLPELEETPPQYLFKAHLQLSRGRRHDVQPVPSITAEPLPSVRKGCSPRLRWSILPSHQDSAILSDLLRAIHGAEDILTNGNFSRGQGSYL